MPADDTKCHGKKCYLNEKIKLENVKIQDNVLHHCHDRGKCTGDLHELKCFSKTEADFKNDHTFT